MVTLKLDAAEFALSESAHIELLSLFIAHRVGKSVSSVTYRGRVMSWPLFVRRVLEKLEHSYPNKVARSCQEWGQHDTAFYCYYLLSERVGSPFDLRALMDAVFNVAEGDQK